MTHKSITSLLTETQAAFKNCFAVESHLYTYHKQYKRHWDELAKKIDAQQSKLSQNDILILEAGLLKIKIDLQITQTKLETTLIDIIALTQKAEIITDLITDTSEEQAIIPKKADPINNP